MTDQPPDRDPPLRISDRLYRLLVESVRDYAIFTLDPAGHIMSWNPGAQRFKGYTAEEAIGRHFSMFYPEADNLAGKPAWELEIATAEGRVEDEGWRLRKDGSRFWANIIITALWDEGTLVGFAKVTRDLTDRVRSEASARQAAARVAEAEAASRAKSEFLTTLSHELRTPLNAIAGYVDLLATGVRGPVTELQLQDLERIRVSQRHLLGLINDLLNYGRIGAGTIMYDVADVAVAGAVSAVMPMITMQAEAREIVLEDGTADSDLAVRADAAKLHQILLNLLGNAVKYCDAGDRVRVEAEDLGTVVAIHVIDTGPGIPPGQLDMIFEPFIQVGRSLTSSHEGTGLGLSISRDLARAMGGDISAISTPGAGSRFTVTFPAAVS